MHVLFRALQRLLVTILFGTFALLLLAYPIGCALAARLVASREGSHHPDYWFLRFGMLSFAILPLGMAGNALYVSLKQAQRKENTLPTSATHAQRTATAIIPPFDGKDVVSIWQSSLEVQQHFNDLELRIRNFAVTLLVAVMGGAAFTLKEHYNVQLGDEPVSLALVVLLAGVLGWLAFYFMDRHWYHRLLIGSVMHTIDNIETPYEQFAPIGLSKRVGHESAILLLKLDRPKGSRTHWIEIHSAEKIDIFYAAGLLFLSLLIAGTLLAPQSLLPPSDTSTPQKMTRDQPCAVPLRTPPHPTSP